MNKILGHKRYGLFHTLFGLLTLLASFLFAYLATDIRFIPSEVIGIIACFIFAMPLVWLDGRKKDYNKKLVK